MLASHTTNDIKISYQVKIKYTCPVNTKKKYQENGTINSIVTTGENATKSHDLSLVEYMPFKRGRS